MRSLLRGQQKGPLPVGWGGERQRVLKSVSWKNSQLLSTWPYTIVRKRREGRVDRRMDGWSEGAEGGGGVKGAGVWEVSVWSYTIKAILKGNTKWSLPPFPSTSLPSLPLWPGPLLSPPLCFCAQRVPHGWTRCILYYSFMYFKRQTAPISIQPLLFSSTSPPFLFPASTSLLQGYKSLSGPDRQRRREGG